MASVTIPSLPPFPPDLKALSSFIQRAEELKNKNPIMSYWCIYYAAQTGLDMRSPKPASRDFLLGLITALESMKKEIGVNDAIDNEAAGAAYVENFALNVFEMADKEDRKGGATRSTAKKFLAAANFLELLRVFEKSNDALTNDEKIRYAKWRAAEIAKAIREGRKPIPPAAAEDEDEDIAQTALDNAPGTSTPTYHSLSDHFLDRSATATPGNWSTIATPGIDDKGFFQTMTVLDSTIPTVASSSTFVDGDGPQDTFVPSIKKVHFSPSVAGGLSSADGSLPPNSPAGGLPTSSVVRGRTSPTSAPLPDSASSGSSRGSFENSPPSIHATLGHAVLPSVPDTLGQLHFESGPVRSLSPNGLPPSHVASAGLPDVPSFPNATVFQHLDGPSVPAGAISPPLLPPAPPYASVYHQPSVPPPPPAKVFYSPISPARPVVYEPSKVPAEDIELSITQIAKAQKHCRLAISALDYEDARHARKELLDALAILDGAK